MFFFSRSPSSYSLTSIHQTWNTSFVTTWLVLHFTISTLTSTSPWHIFGLPDLERRPQKVSTEGNIIRVVWIGSATGQVSYIALFDPLRFTDSGSQAKVYNPCIGFGTGDLNLQVPKPPGPGQFILFAVFILLDLNLIASPRAQERSRWIRLLRLACAA
jgi:hypothetical protein